MLADLEKEATGVFLNYHHIDKYNIRSLGTVEVYRHRNETDQIIKKIIDMQNLTSEEARAVEVATSLTGPGLIDIIAYKEITSSQHELFLEDIVETLADEIQIRQSDGNRFSETEIVSMLANMLCALTKIQQYNLPHGQISPAAVFKTAHSEYKLLHPLVIGELAYRTSKASNENSFLLHRAPELDYDLSKKNQADREDSFKIDPFKIDVFYLGVTVIEACFLDVSDFDIEFKLNAIKSYYSFPLVDLLQKMIEKNHLIRSDPYSLLQWLKKFDLVPETVEKWSPSRKSFSDSPRLSTGTTINDIKRVAPSFQPQPETLAEQEFLSPLEVRGEGFGADYIKAIDKEFLGIRAFLENAFK